jgi:tRNA threonylcarbamoyladenosine biosynthesis protein TsaB
MNNPIILSVDTATSVGSLAITKGEEVLNVRTWGRAEHQQSHSNNVLVELDIALKEASISITDIDLFAATIGPGSFTGLRIGLATIKAFAANLNRKCIGVPTLEALAYAAGPSTCTVVALLPAGRGEVFAQFFQSSPNGTVQPVKPTAHLPPDRLLQELSKDNNPLVFVGEGATLNEAAIKNRALELNLSFRNEAHETNMPSVNWVLVSIDLPLACYVASLARANLNNALEAQSLHAIYVRPSDAELKR